MSGSGSKVKLFGVRWISAMVLEFGAWRKARVVDSHVCIVQHHLNLELIMKSNGSLNFDRGVADRFEEIARLSMASHHIRRKVLENHCLSSYATRRRSGSMHRSSWTHRYRRYTGSQAHFLPLFLIP